MDDDSPGEGKNKMLWYKAWPLGVVAAAVAFPLLMCGIAMVTCVSSKKTQGKTPSGMAWCCCFLVFFFVCVIG